MYSFKRRKKRHCNLKIWNIFRGRRGSVKYILPVQGALTIPWKMTWHSQRCTRIDNVHQRHGIHNSDEWKRRENTPISPIYKSTPKRSPMNPEYVPYTSTSTTANTNSTSWFRDRPAKISIVHYFLSKPLFHLYKNLKKNIILKKIVNCFVANNKRIQFWLIVSKDATKTYIMCT